MESKIFPTSHNRNIITFACPECKKTSPFNRNSAFINQLSKKQIIISFLCENCYQETLLMKIDGEEIEPFEEMFDKKIIVCPECEKISPLNKHSIAINRLLKKIHTLIYFRCPDCHQETLLIKMKEIDGKIGIYRI